ncbi:MAG: hypothetical protein ACRDO7_10975 [Nocardioidaceae bacterium]
MTTLHDEVVGVATALSAIDTRCGQVAAKLGDLTAEDAGPRPSTDTFDEALTRLRRTLSDLSAEAADAAEVVRRFAADDDAPDPEATR